MNIHMKGDNMGDKASGKQAMHNHINQNKKGDNWRQSVGDKRGDKRRQTAESQQCIPI